MFDGPVATRKLHPAGIVIDTAADETNFASTLSTTPIITALLYKRNEMVRLNVIQLKKIEEEFVITLYLRLW